MDRTTEAHATTTMRVRVISFATDAYRPAADAMRDTAVIHGADSVRVYAPRDLPASLLDLGRAAPTRGFGWWAWKPWAIRRELEGLRDEDDDAVVVYCDAAACFVRDVRDLVAYSGAVDAGTGPGAGTGTGPGAGAGAGVGLFALGGHAVEGYTVGAWTKPSALAALGVGPDVAARPMVNAAVIVATRRGLDFVRRWEELCTPETLRDDPAFERHRHDQSVLSVVAARAGVVLRPDPTQHGDADRPAGVERFVAHHRMPDPLARGGAGARIAVITATAGGRHLEACVDSVQRQTQPGLEHWLVVDGPEARDAVDAVVARHREKRPIVVTYLPRKVGGDGWNAHRVNGSFPFLVDADLVAWLDDDNAWEPRHLELLVAALADDPEAHWAHSLRTIVDQSSREVCPDACECLGCLAPTVLGRDDFLADTSSFLMRRDLAIASGFLWNARARDPEREEVDRALTKALIRAAPGTSSRAHTLRYRVDSRPADGPRPSVSAGFFLAGNAARGHDFVRRPTAYVFHFSDAATADLFRGDGPRAAGRALDEWQPSMWRALADRVNLVDGFAMLDGARDGTALPPGAVCLVAMCDPGALPLGVLARRRDLRRVLYTAEGPNARHAAQWTRGFLAAHFDVVLAHWEALVDGPPPGVAVAWAPHNTHFLTLPEDAPVLRRNRGAGRSVVAVLEYRGDGAARFEIDGEVLTALDGLRGTVVGGLRDATVVGRGWDAWVPPEGAPRVRIVPGGKGVDARHAVDWYADHTFALIVENSDAAGYVSEKVYDALIAGAVPLYWGNPGRRLLEHVPEFWHVVVDVRGLDARGVQDAIDAIDVPAARERVYAARERVLAAVGARDLCDRVLRAAFV